MRLAADSKAAADPRFGVTYRAAFAVEIDDNSSLFRRFTVHVPDTAGKPEAQRAGRFLAQVWRAANRRFGNLANGLRGAPVDVWLTRTGEAGGEQFRSNLYIYDFASERSGIEWARELAHEYGHYLLPGASGYSSPESWSNGLLGERLFLRWLRDDLADGRLVPDDLPYVKIQDLNDYCEKQPVPLIDRMKDNGPDPKGLARPDGKGMDAFTSLLLYADEVYGPKSLLDMLDYLPGSRAAGARGFDFLTAFTTFAGRLREGSLRLDSNRPIYVYLPPGRIQLFGERGVKLSVKPAPKTTNTPPGESIAIRSASPGWHVLAAAGPPGPTTVTWKCAE